MKVVNNIPSPEECLSTHARLRMAQRCLSGKDVAYVCEHGHIVHRAGAIFIVLRRNDIPATDAPRMERLNGAVVAWDRSASIVLTVYRNENALKHLLKKPKWGRNKRSRNFKALLEAV